ncbi:MlaD family protein [Mycolicibacterium sp. 120266]|uniref:MlaD family protein n=1 Tax=Mycolicibacterium sp. 120266 TaxID=3090601 RepID=UPI00299DF8ED|nr:MlaD family protein [Mycolicibacterium sp. 120266]MDX1875985.1 MlaD family protein [Mycolicibacterium sp. 120266]
MQSLRASRLLRSPVSWGVATMVVAAVVGLVLTYVYYHPPSQEQPVSFYTDDANAIRVGDEVRMAGIKVGTVTALTLEPNQVLVQAKVDNHAFVGDQSQVDVRMLTVVGGYYVNVASMGSMPLGEAVIPASRVTMPYSLIRTLADTTKITEHVDTKPVNESLNQISQGLSGTNVQVVAATIDAGNALMSTVERQRGQVTEILNLSDEYIRALAQYRDKFAQLVRKISIATQTMVIYDKGVSQTLQGLGEVLLAIKPLADAYEAHQAEFVEKIRSFLERGRSFVERNGLTIRALKRVQNLFDRILNAQNADPGLLATDLCVPVPGSAC